MASIETEKAPAVPNLGYLRRRRSVPRIANPGRTSGERVPTQPKIQAEILRSPYDAVNRLTDQALVPQGKRIRALISVEIAREFQPKTTIPLSLIEAMELLQYFTLIHDDIIDNSPQRRGFDSLWKRFGRDVALLYGDFVHAKVTASVAATRAVSVRDRLSLIAAYASASASIQEGQMLETLNLFNVNLTESEYIEIARAKTSSLIRLAVYLPWVLFSNDPAILDQLNQFAESFGIAFQIYNDIIDFQDGHGKRTLDDLRSGKMTLPVVLHAQLASSSDPVLRAYGRGTVEVLDLEQFPSALKTTNAVGRAYGKMMQHLSMGEKALEAALPSGISGRIENLFRAFRSVKIGEEPRLQECQ